MKDLIDRELWNDALKNKIIAENGSIQNISEIPSELKELYKTVWEISQKDIIEMAADRGAFIDQSQSLNIHMVSSYYPLRIARIIDTYVLAEKFINLIIYTSSTTIQQEFIILTQITIYSLIKFGF